MKTSIYSQHREHAEWLNVLFFYKDDMKIMQKRIEEIAKKNTSKEILMQVEHFQNQLIIQNNSLDDMRKHIEKDEQILVHSIEKNIVASDHRQLEDHSEEREDITALKKISKIYAEA